MKTILKHPVDMKHRKVKVYVDWCYDPRFEELLMEVIKMIGVGNCDIHNHAGGALDLSDPNRPGYQNALNQITISLDKHDPKEIWLVMHWDCAACGGSEAFGNPEGESSGLENMLKRAKANVQNFLSGKGITEMPVRIMRADSEGLHEIE